jgi:hypothetical protein
MSGSYTEKPSERRPFLVTPYVADAAGRLRPEMPACCPLGADESESGCALAVHHERFRKTGPFHFLTVVRCRTHGASFTLYPPGYAPYRRQSLLRLSPDGVQLEGDAATSGERRDFAGTLFEAAFDARDARAWARDAEGFAADRWWGTQGRHLRLAARLLGVGWDLAERVREAIAAVLSIDALSLRERSSAKGYRAIGAAVCDVLSQLSGGVRRAFTLCVCGHLVGKWGEPLVWDAKRQLVERSRFLAGGTSRPT